MILWHWLKILTLELEIAQRISFSFWWWIVYIIVSFNHGLFYWLLVEFHQYKTTTHEYEEFRIIFFGCVCCCCCCCQKMWKLSVKRKPIGRRAIKWRNCFTLKSSPPDSTPEQWIVFVHQSRISLKGEHFVWVKKKKTNRKYDCEEMNLFLLWLWPRDWPCPMPNAKPRDWELVEFIRLLLSSEPIIGNAFFFLCWFNSSGWRMDEERESDKTATNPKRTNVAQSAERK